MLERCDKGGGCDGGEADDTEIGAQFGTLCLSKGGFTIHDIEA